LWRTLQTFNVTRVVIALVLIAFLSVGTKKGFWVSDQFLYQEICAVYLGLAIVFALLAAYWKRRFLLQVVLQLAIDIFFISGLYVAAGGMRSGLVILFLFPLAGSAILIPLLPALFFVSVVTLVLLTESGFELLKSAESALISRSGLYGAAFFAAVYVINRLAARLIKQEKLAAQHSQDLRIQQAINRLVIADMGDGILVVSRDSTIFTANPAAERMLGLSITEDGIHYKLTELTSLAPIAEAFLGWSSRRSHRASDDSGAPIVVAVKPGDELSLQASTTARGGRRDPLVHLKLRFATVNTPGLSGDRTVIFLQDVSEIENQAQQLKLASMGRLTASIAHEVRNPLSAISYAASLLGEEASNSTQTRLVTIVGDNVKRLNRMIEDILKLSRKAQPHGDPIVLSETLAEILEEFQETHSLKDGWIHVCAMDPYQVRFDPMHLREVVVNLLSNALRYASGRKGSIRLQLMSDLANRLELHVQDDGPPITAEVRAHLFEPFYTTSSKGTGLGLYMARELCLNNGAMLDYEYRVDPCSSGSGEAAGRFVIRFAIADSL
jgi:two-component system sensor histidine kinase PilS (NtrC family)